MTASLDKFLKRSQQSVREPFADGRTFGVEIANLRPENQNVECTEADEKIAKKICQLVKQLSMTLPQTAEHGVSSRHTSPNLAALPYLEPSVSCTIVWEGSAKAKDLVEYIFDYQSGIAFILNNLLGANDGRGGFFPESGSSNRGDEIRESNLDLHGHASLILKSLTSFSRNVARSRMEQHERTQQVVSTVCDCTIGVTCCQRDTVHHCEPSCVAGQPLLEVPFSKDGKTDLSETVIRLEAETKWNNTLDECYDGDKRYMHTRGQGGAESSRNAGAESSLPNAGQSLPDGSLPTPLLAAESSKDALLLVGRRCKLYANGSVRNAAMRELAVMVGANEHAVYDLLLGRVVFPCNNHLGLTGNNHIHVLENLIGCLFPAIKSPFFKFMLENTTQTNWQGYITKYQSSHARFLCGCSPKQAEEILRGLRSAQNAVTLFETSGVSAKGQAIARHLMVHLAGKTERPLILVLMSNAGDSFFVGNLGERKGIRKPFSLFLEDNLLIARYMYRGQQGNTHFPIPGDGNSCLGSEACKCAPVLRDLVNRELHAWLFARYNEENRKDAPKLPATFLEFILANRFVMRLRSKPEMRRVAEFEPVHRVTMESASFPRALRLVRAGIFVDLKLLEPNRPPKSDNPEELSDEEYLIMNNLPVVNVVFPPKFFDLKHLFQEGHFRELLLWHRQPGPSTRFSNLAFRTRSILMLIASKVYEGVRDEDNVSTKQQMFHLSLIALFVPLASDLRNGNLGGIQAGEQKWSLLYPIPTLIDLLSRTVRNRHDPLFYIQTCFVRFVETFVEVHSPRLVYEYLSGRLVPQNENLSFVQRGSAGRVHEGVAPHVEANPLEEDETSQMLSQMHEDPPVDSAAKYFGDAGGTMLNATKFGELLMRSGKLFPDDPANGVSRSFSIPPNTILTKNDGLNIEYELCAKLRFQKQDEPKPKLNRFEKQKKPTKLRREDVVRKKKKKTKKQKKTFKTKRTVLFLFLFFSFFILTNS